MKKEYSLKSKILLYLILFTTIPLIIASTSILYQMYKSKEESVYSKHLQIMKIVSEETDNIVTDIEYLGEYVKDKYPVKKHNLLTGLVRVQKNITTILILDNNGKLLDFASSVKTNVFKGFDYSYTKYFRAIKSGKNTYWSDVYLSYLSSLPSISYTLRVDKNHIAVLVIDLSVLNDLARKFKSENGDSMVRIMDKDGVFLAHPDRPEYIQQRKKILNSSIYKKYMSNRKYEEKQIIFDGISKNKNIGMYSITKKLKWYIIVKESYDFLFNRFNKLILFMSLFIVLLILISAYFAYMLSQSILKPLSDVNNNMNRIAHDKDANITIDSNFKELNRLISSFELMQEKIKDREEKVKLEIHKNKQKDMQIFEQSKMVSMGEMIGNIAHQWRQPLSVISTVATGMQMQKEFGILNDDKFNTDCEMINHQAQYLSKTIDDFKNFIKGDRKLINFNLNENINSFLTLVNPTIKKHNLELILSLDENIKIDGYPNELKQCFINIFNNSKDALIEKVEKNRMIFISTKIENNNAIIQFKDNAGGIPEDIIFKIFDPYFTTKHQSQGTGLGLNMTFNLITDGMKGSIVATNTTYTYNNTSNTGAMFTISLPLYDKKEDTEKK